jgi:hypothetical protein
MTDRDLFVGSRMTPELLARVRAMVNDHNLPMLHDLLAELDAVTAERDGLIKAKDEWEAIAAAERDAALQRARHSEGILNMLRGKR